jgi:hypothetical protein
LLRLGGVRLIKARNTFNLSRVFSVFWSLIILPDKFSLLGRDCLSANEMGVASGMLAKTQPQSCVVSAGGKDRDWSGIQNSEG